MITRVVELSCDHDGCDTAYVATSEAEVTSVRLTRVDATIAGWTFTDGKDYCPTHKPANDVVDRIRELAGQRLTDGQIGARLGLHRGTVQNLRAANGIPAGLGRVGRPSHGLTPRRRDALAAAEAAR